MSTPDRIPGRWNALEFGVRAGRRVARLFTVYACEVRGSKIVSAELADEPAEELALPLPRDVARDWLLLSFEDLEPAIHCDLVARLTRPVDPLGDLA